ncbi:hypothetical protein PCC9214_05442 (plasmid) [Planktothrix tepida]|uniref:Uncharacterized protein n=1 Tax=Planktothrix tepida PCC 9214 TaxID=671072 RepID=A0A1J1LPW2_9CYAN|nr:hypothetical protein [Planktothrix tepida]CAD5988698.1 hypothetical protein PCC9214_05442 [Planktothrix tepida]CUR33956.1 conserved hypothetical protein [Planktothrix tepida PCC 9214]
MLRINSNITFAGIQGKVLSISPHGSYLTVQLSKRIVIVGAINNKFQWEENPEQQSGFVSFITYIGCSKPELSAISDQIQFYGGQIDDFRDSKRNKHFPLEFKVRKLSPESLVQLLNELQ